jgi:hypothetical protein
VSPDLLFWFGFALKMAMTATIVVITSVAVERSGPFVGALIGALPTAAGAAYTILALEHPPSFIAASAIGSVAINAAVAIFAAVYAMLAQRHGLIVSLGGAGVVACDRYGLAHGRVDATRRGYGQRHRLCHYHPVQLALSRHRRTGQIRTPAAGHSVARTGRRHRRRSRYGRQFDDWLVRLRHVRVVPDHPRQLDRHFCIRASAARPPPACLRMCNCR